MTRETKNVLTDLKYRLSHYEAEPYPLHRKWLMSVGSKPWLLEWVDWSFVGVLILAMKTAIATVVATGIYLVLIRLPSGSRIWGIVFIALIYGGYRFALIYTRRRIALHDLAQVLTTGQTVCPICRGWGIHAYDFQHQKTQMTWQGSFLSPLTFTAYATRRCLCMRCVGDGVIEKSTDSDAESALSISWLPVRTIPIQPPKALMPYEELDVEQKAFRDRVFKKRSWRRSADPDDPRWSPDENNLASQLKWQSTNIRPPWKFSLRWPCSREAHLEQLKALLDKGLIDENDYARKKKEILDKM